MPGFSVPSHWFSPMRATEPTPEEKLENVDDYLNRESLVSIFSEFSNILSMTFLKKSSNFYFW
jgi:hypothetical protein